MSDRITVNPKITPRLTFSCITDVEQFEIDVPIGDVWMPILRSAAILHIANRYEPRYTCIVHPPYIYPEYRASIEAPDDRP